MSAASAAGPGTGRLAGRRVLVVGAGTRPTDDPEAPPGNGRAIAVTLGRQGATVACADRDRAAARATASMAFGEGPSGFSLLASFTIASCPVSRASSSIGFPGEYGRIFRTLGRNGKFIPLL